MTHIHKNIYTTLLFFSSLVVLCSCGGKDKEGTIFGTIPSIYETEIMTIVKDAHALYPNEEDEESLKRYMMDRADSVYLVAKKKSHPYVKELIGNKIPYTMEENLGYKVNGDISVLQIILPEFSSENKALQAKVMFNASFEDDTDSLFYILSSSDSTDYAFGCITSSEMNIKERVVFGNLEVPNIPAVYQMKCNSIRFVTPETYNASISKIRGKQKNLREEFYDVNNIYQQSN